MGRLDGSRDECSDRQFQQNIQSDLDMLVTEAMHHNTKGRLSGGSRGYATSGWRNRGPFFWIMLAIMIYWFFLRPLGL